MLQYQYQCIAISLKSYEKVLKGEGKRGKEKCFYKSGNHTSIQCIQCKVKLALLIC